MPNAILSGAVRPGGLWANEGSVSGRGIFWDGSFVQGGLKSLVQDAVSTMDAREAGGLIVLASTEFMQGYRSARPCAKDGHFSSGDDLQVLSLPSEHAAFINGFVTYGRRGNKASHFKIVMREHGRLGVNDPAYTLGLQAVYNSAVKKELDGRHHDLGRLINGRPVTLGVNNGEWTIS